MVIDRDADRPLYKQLAEAIRAQIEQGGWLRVSAFRGRATLWGTLTLGRTRPEAGKQWTDTGEVHDDRGLKHRADNETRPVPILPALVLILAEHVESYGVAADGRPFRTSSGRPFSASAINSVWNQARLWAFTPAQVLSPLARTPYDLRHAAVSMWLNAGVAPPEVAERAGHSVQVLLKVHAKCLDGQQEIANRRIEAALSA